MKFYKNLYIGETIKNPNRVKQKLRLNVGQMNIYIIVPAKGKDQLEIFHCAFLKQKYIRKQLPIVVGIANGYEEAVDIIVEITKESITKNGNADIKKYLFPNMEKI